MSSTISPLRIDVAQLGARMHYSVPAGFAKADALNRFYTDIWYPRIRPFLPPIISKIKGLNRLSGRYHPDVPAHSVVSCPLRGLRYALDLQLSNSEQQRIRHFVKMGKWFAGWVANRSDATVDCCYGYNSASLEWFASTKNREALKVLEQTLVPRIEQKNLLQHEFERHQTPWPDDEWNQAYEAREKQEWALADLIVCGSDFVKDALIKHGVPSDKIEVVPYGTPADTKHNPAEQKTNDNNKFSLLFVGHGGIRKGLPSLFEALQKITSTEIELTIAGDVSDLPDRPSTIGNHRITYLNKVERSKIRELMYQSDAFVFPSLCEGSATVIYEAMQTGLPVLCTPNSGSVITHNKDGLIVPVHDSNKLSDAISQVATDADFRQKLSNNAIRTAAHYTSESFSQRLFGVIKKNLK